MVSLDNSRDFVVFISEVIYYFFLLLGDGVMGVVFLLVYLLDKLFVRWKGVWERAK